MTGILFWLSVGWLAGMAFAFHLCNKHNHW